MTDNILTLEVLYEAARKLRSTQDQQRPSWTATGGYAAAPALGFLTRSPILESPYLLEAIPRKLSRWERLRVRFEDAADRAELIYPWPRVRRDDSRPSPYIYSMGGYFLCHPETAASIRKIYA